MLDRTKLVLALLILAVPLQLLLTLRISDSAEQRAGSVQRLAESLSSIGLVGQSLAELATDWLAALTGPSSDWLAEQESPATEVYHRVDPRRTGHFGLSLRPRRQRPKSVQFHVGQILLHKRLRYRCVVIGWDLKVTAPGEFLARNSMVSGEPGYLVLVDERDPVSAEFAYLTQESFESLGQAEAIQSRRIHDYFSDFDGAQYLPRNWLRKLYPLD